MRWTFTNLPKGYPFKNKIVIEWDAFTEGFWVFKTKYEAGKKVLYGDTTIWYEEDSEGNLSKASTSVSMKCLNIQRTAEKMKYDKANK